MHIFVCIHTLCTCSGEGRVFGTGHPAARAVSGLSVQEVAGFSCLASATTQSSDGGWGSNVQAPSGSGMLLLNRAGNGLLLGDQNNTLTADEQVVLLSLFTLRSRGWHSSAADGRGLRKLSLTFPFVLQITFGVNQNDVTVHLPGHQFTFPNRLNLSVFDYLDIQGDFTLQSLSWE